MKETISKKTPYSEATIALLDFIVRPPRLTSYTEADLGQKKMEINDTTCIREDFDIENHKGLKMKCSYYHFDDTVNSLFSLDSKASDYLFAWECKF